MDRQGVLDDGNDVLEMGGDDVYVYEYVGVTFDLTFKNDAGLTSEKQTKNMSVDG